MHLNQTQAGLARGFDPEFKQNTFLTGEEEAGSAWIMVTRQTLPFCGCTVCQMFVILFG